MLPPAVAVAVIANAGTTYGHVTRKIASEQTVRAVRQLKRRLDARPAMIRRIIRLDCDPIRRTSACTRVKEQYNND